MKKLIFAIMALSVSYGICAGEKGVGFNAPTVNGKNNVASPQAGEIIYDTSDTQFWGYSDTSTWLPLGSGGVQSIPTGTVITFAGATCPTGYLAANGSAISRSTYADLFTAIGTANGQGDGSTTFNLPDYRGLFLRMVDGSAGRDPDATSRTAMNTGGNTGNNVGSVQSDVFSSHTHSQNPHTHTINTHNASGNGGYVTTSNGAGTWPVATTNSTTATNQNTGGNETRPKNAYVLYCVKY